MVLFFLNVQIAGIFFENCTDCTDFKKKCTDCTDFFSKIVRIVRISSKNVRIFSKKFWPPCICILNFIFCLFSSNTVVPKTHLFVLNLLNYSNSQFTNPFIIFTFIESQSQLPLQLISISIPNLFKFPIGPYLIHSNFLILILIPIRPIPTLVDSRSGFLVSTYIKLVRNVLYYC